MTQTMTFPKPASAKSINYLASLLGEDKTGENFCEWFLAWEENGQAAVSAAIKVALANKPVPAPKFTLIKGQWHFLGGVFLRVAVSQSTGKMYAKARVPGSGFVFAAGVVYKLSEKTLVNVSHVDEISAYGHTYHRCVFCNLPLDQPESITAGYGKVCADNHGLPW